MDTSVLKMREEFDKILRSYGHNILLQRRTQDTDLDNPEFSNTLERHTVRHMLPATRSLPTTKQEKMEGVLNTSERVYYFRWNANPFDGDRIYEYDEGSVRSEDKKITYIVDQAMPLRGENGIIIYWMVGATRESSN